MSLLGPPATVVMGPPIRAVGAGKAAGLDGRHAAIDVADAAIGAVAVGGLVRLAVPVAPQLLSTATPAARPNILESLAACPMPG
jgi:hypothetical protein